MCGRRSQAGQAIGAPCPLRGLRVLNTRSLEDSEAFGKRLASLGADVISLPTTETALPDDLAPLDAVIAAIAAGTPGAPAFDWIGFTSKHAVQAFMERLLRTPVGRRRGLDASALVGIRIAAVGPATGEALAHYGLVPDLVPDRAAGRHLASALGDVAGRRILLPRSEIALADLPDALRAGGASITEVVAYVTRPARANPMTLESVLQGEADAACFFSPSAIDGLSSQVAPRRLAEVLAGAAVVCVGETTAQAARKLGLGDVVVAAEASAEGVVGTLIRWRTGSR